ncbi:MAG: SMP-30/gluconolactonase/LRE family protein [Myxococcaceae bacterium]|nr:SMP-30/gluconolactonase/LRE family protein [Myxococcaceae bacterium]
MKLKLALGLLVLLLGYLLFWPTRYAPGAWGPPPDVPLELNDRLKTAELFHGELPGPEAIAFDAQGRIVTGLRDGRLVRVEHDGGVETLASRSGGRILGLKYGPDARLWLCDAYLGLGVLNGDGGIETLFADAGFADDLDFGDDGSVYFTDASLRNDVAHAVDDLIEHQTTGRLLRWKDGVTTLVSDGFSFANGVAFGTSRDWLVMTETGTYKLWKVHVPSGRREVFADSLPGFPDNVTFSPERKVFWVALGSPRNTLVERLAGAPFLREAIFRLPKAVQPAPVKHSTVLAFDESGKQVENLQWKDPATYSPIASVIERDGALYMGSYLVGGYWRYALR